jgi:hypothetical protein
LIRNWQKIKKAHYHLTFGPVLPLLWTNTSTRIPIKTSSICWWQ